MNPAEPALEPLPEVTAYVDRRLVEICRQVDWLRYVTPDRPEGLWREFRDGGFKRTPDFNYADAALDIESARNGLLDLPVGEIESPVYEALLAEKRRELDRQLELIELRGTDGFLQVSIDLFGVTDAELYAAARGILDAVEHDESTDDVFVGVDHVAKAAHAQLAAYRRQCPDFSAGVMRSVNTVAGLMVSDGHLLISEAVRIRRGRLDALLHHEIGTHILTRYNGARQALKQLGSGLAHYDELQEGLGVLSEYLAGNLSALRLRTLAARVVAVRMLTDGASFKDVFETMRGNYGFGDHAAFTIAIRVFRGGGLTKDIVYLRGLRDLLAYLREGNPFEPLFLGKFSLSQLTALRELDTAGQLLPPRLLPSYFHNAAARQRLSDCVRTPLDQLYQRLVA